MKNKLWGFFLIALICFCAFFFNYIYDDAKQTAIKDLNEKQTSYAIQANIGIDDFFKQWTNLLISLTRVDTIANLDETGKKYISFIYETNKGDITAVTRVDEKGKIIFTAPFNSKAIGQDISSQKHIRDVTRFHKPTVSDVFKSVQGFDMVALHVPVLKNGKYQGTLAIGINFQILAKRYLEAIRIGKTGYAWMISRDGIEIYCPVPGHTGNSVFENCKDYPDIIAMAKEMIKGKQGITTYTFDQIREQKVELVKKHAVYMPIHVGQTFWSIVVASSESEILSTLEHFRNNLMLIIGLFLVGGTIFSFIGLKGWFIVREEQKRQRAEDALRESESKLANIIEFLPDATFVIDLEGKVIAWNRAIEEMTGISKKEMIGQGDHAYTVPFYGERRKHLLDLIDIDDKDLESKYQNVRKKGNTLYAEAHTHALYGGKGAYVFATGAPLFDAQGNRVGAIESIREITEKKRVEEALRESEEKYRMLAENASDIIWSMDLDLNFTYISPSVEKIQGWTAEEMKSLYLQDIMPPDSLARVMKVIEEEIALEKTPGADPKRTRRFEIEEYHKDGSTIWMELIARFLRDEQGYPIGMTGITRDITDRKQTEVALRESERRLHDIIQGSPIPAFVIGKDHKVIYWNKALEELSGINAEEVIGTSEQWWAFYSKARPCMSDLLVDQAIEKIPQWYLDKHNKSKLLEEAYEATDFFPEMGDTGKWLRFTAAIIRDSQGDIVGAMETLEDITERKEAEEALNSERERLASILDGIPVPTFVINLDHRVVLWNRYNEIYTGISKEQVLGKHLDLSLLFQEKSPPILAELILEMGDEELMAKFGGKGLRKSEVQPHTFESTGRIWIRGEERTVSIQAARIFDLKGDVVGAIQTAPDITEHKLLESQLRQAQKMQAIGTLAGGIAHDFNNILSAILGYTDMALTNQKMDDHQRHCLEQVYKAGERARDLVKQILTFSRQQDQQRKPVLIAPIIKDSIKLLRSFLPATIKITQNIKDALAMILADSTQIHQVVMNLCTNAFHAMRERVGILDIQLVRERLELSGTPRPLNLTAGNYTKLSVSDTGQGIDSAIIDRIFDPFFTTKEPGEGTGLGLSVVYGIVRDHGGAIDVSSEQGKGTTFTVYFPLIEPEKRRQEQMPELIPGGNERILFIDDEAALAELGSTMMTSLGYHVTTRTSSIEALEAFRASPHSFDLVITDMTMPNMRGDDLAMELLKIRPNIPIILCTGFSEMISEEKAKNLGISQFIMKPISKKELAKAVREVLGR